VTPAEQTEIDEMAEKLYWGLMAEALIPDAIYDEVIEKHQAMIQRDEDDQFAQDYPLEDEVQGGEPAPLSMQVRDLDISVRVWNVLDALGLETVQEVLAEGRANLLKARNFGKVSLANLEAALSKIGVTWSSTRSEPSPVRPEFEREIEVEMEHPSVETHAVEGEI
jgi:DNA-directed RNA polymerase alpha subunit